MTCRDTKKLLGPDGRASVPAGERQALEQHLEVCGRCGEAAKVARLSSALLAALREEIAPDPTFYARLRTRIVQGGAGEPDATLLQVLGFARRLVPAMALGVLLLAASISLTRPLSPQAGLGRGIYAFSLEELNLPAAVGRPSQDQMLAFVLMRGDDVRGAGSDVRDERSGR